MSMWSRLAALVIASAHLMLPVACQDAATCDAPAATMSDEFPVAGKLILTQEDLQDFPQERLVKLMGHDLAWTRIAAARVLANRGAASVPVFVTALGSEDWRVVRAGQDGLIALLAQAKEDKALRKAVIETTPALRETLKHAHYYVRMGALDCFKGMGIDAKAAVNDICVHFNDEDFLGVAPRAAAVVSAIGPENIESTVLMPVLKEGIRSLHISTRSAAINLVAKLDEKRQRTLIPDMLYALKTPMLDGYTRFQVQGRIAAVLMKLEVEEVFPLMVAILNKEGWGECHRILTFLPKIMTYGDKALVAIPAIEKGIRVQKELGRDKMERPEYALLINSLKKLRAMQK